MEDDSLIRGRFRSLRLNFGLASFFMNRHETYKGMRHIEVGLLGNVGTNKDNSIATVSRKQIENAV